MAGANATMCMLWFCFAREAGKLFVHVKEHKGTQMHQEITLRTAHSQKLGAITEILQSATRLLNALTIWFYDLELLLNCRCVHSLLIYHRPIRKTLDSV